ncbi:hypothetical protein SEPCBS57363_002042 [Sporothrix epigloea]|uniref:DUF8035 domain-containing protein n=1 Tax=Sporothrix epigloea TaxID=1892477 RepID=A0ABP0DFB5_9PEZI
MSEDRQVVPLSSTVALRASTPRTVLVPRLHHSPSSSPSAEGYTTSTSSDSDSDNGYNKALSLISTSELLAIDWREQELYAERAGITYRYPQLLHDGSDLSESPINSLTRQFSNYEVSPSAAALIRRNSNQPEARLGVPKTSRPIQIPSQSAAHLPLPIASHRYSTSAPEPPLDESAAFGIEIPASQKPSGTRRYAPSHGLAPDSKGNAISPNAIWTKISRRLVSPEVLEKAGVRYEARPSFVAILGMLDKKTVSEYVRQSAEARRSRYSFANARGRLPRNSPLDDRHTYFGADVAEDPRARLKHVQSMPDVGNGHQRRSFVNENNVGPIPKSESHYLNGHASPSPSPSAERNYPFIVSPPATEVNGGRSLEGGSPDSQPKSILKNKNTNQVRFKDGKLVEVSPGDTESRDARSGHQSHHNHHSSRNRDRSRHDVSSSRLHKDHSRNRSDDQDRDQDRHRRRRDPDRDRDMDRNIERVRDRDRERPRDQSRNRDKDRDREREREGDHSRARDRDEREKDHESRRQRRSDDRVREHERNSSHNYDRERDREREHNRSYGRDNRDSRSSLNRPYRDQVSRSQRDLHNGHDRDRDRDRERDSRDRHDREGRDRDSGRRRFRDTLSAAGIGGAAGSLFSVLTDAVTEAAANL